MICVCAAIIQQADASGCPKSGLIKGFLAAYGIAASHLAYRTFVTGEQDTLMSKATVAVRERERERERESSNSAPLSPQPHLALPLPRAVLTVHGTSVLRRWLRRL